MMDGCLAATSPFAPVPPVAAMSPNASASGVGVSSGEIRTAVTESAPVSVVSATGLMSA